MARLRGFRALAHRVAPETLVNEVLDRFFTAASEAVLQYGGVVDKFVGESLLAVFGWPAGAQDDAINTVTCARVLQAAFTRLRAEWQGSLGTAPALSIGIGHGLVIGGSIGSIQHQDYTVFGDAVDIAFSLSERAHGGETLISQSLTAQLREPLEGITFDEFPPIKVGDDAVEHEIVLMRTDATS